MKTTEKTIMRYPHEILDNLQKERYVNKRVKLLQDLNKDESFILKTLIQCQFLDRIQFDMPEGAPPYTPHEISEDKQPVSIRKSITSLVQCVKEFKASPIRKERTFIDLLEKVHPRDAEILIAVKDKKLNEMYSVLKGGLIRQAWPNLLPIK